ncbi:MAG: glycosyltransferase family 39 protein [Candidatus Omnitrophica bacterium]|jgi:hypothetical protein|nr:glycosyltransferase family 39 protein [Candidatus Omnitrophota bacterium]
MAIKNKYWVVVCLALIVCFHLANNYIWLANSTDIVGVDVANHLYHQLRFHDKFKEIIFSPYYCPAEKITGFIGLFHSSMAFPSCVYWPNLVYFFSSVFALAFGTALLTVKMGGFFYLLALFLSVYAIGKRMGGRGCGVLSAFFISMYPLIFESSRQYGLDLPLTAVVSLAFLFLLRSEYFTRLKYSVLFGLAAGAGMLIKGQFIFFLAAPFVLTAGVYLFADSPRKLTAGVCRNICVSVLLAVLISSLWWAGKIDAVLNSLLEHGASAQKFLESNTVTRMYAPEYYLYNIRTLFFDSLGVVFGIAFLPAFLFFIRAKIRDRWIFLAWLLLPIALFSAIFVVKHERFLMPVLPVIALISAWGVCRLKNLRIRLTAVLGLVILSLAQYYALSYHNFWYETRFEDKTSVSLIGSSSYGRSPYVRKPYYDREKLDLIRKAARIVSGSFTGKGERAVGVAMLGGHVSVFETMYWMYFFDPRIRVLDWLEHYEDFYLAFPELEYVIICSYRSEGLSWPRGREFMESAERNRWVRIRMSKYFFGWEKKFNAFVQAEKDFELVETLDFGNGITWYIHKRKDLE